MMTDESDKLSAQETKRRMDEALKRALVHPPLPHKAIVKKGGTKAVSKPRQKEERES